MKKWCERNRKLNREINEFKMRSLDEFLFRRSVNSSSFFFVSGKGRI